MSDEPQPSSSCAKTVCPVCDKLFTVEEIEPHVDRCLFLNSTENGAGVSSSSKELKNSQNQVQAKRSFSIFEKSPSVASKRSKVEEVEVGSTSVRTVADMERAIIDLSDEEEEQEPRRKVKVVEKDDSQVPLAEKMRPVELTDYIGQEQIIGKNTVLRTLFESNSIPSMIFWGPPGCGKTTLAHIIAAHCKKHENMRFVKLSATMSGVNDVKEAVKVAKNELKFKRKTILFMDEIHRFNKLQQDIFLPHVESGTVTLLGATTENPSFSLNSALLSRCRVIVLEKLAVEPMVKILERALPQYETVMFENNNQTPDIGKLPFIPR